MKYHLALWRETDTHKITSACGVIGTPENFVMSKQSFLANAEENPATTCKRCMRIYNKRRW